MRGHSVSKTRVNALVPRIHFFRKMDCRVKPGNDVEKVVTRSKLRVTLACYSCFMPGICMPGIFMLGALPAGLAPIASTS